MEGFTIIDGVVAAVVVLSGILAYSRGLVRETLAILGWIAAAIVAFVLAPTVEPLMKQVPVLDDFLDDSCELAIIAAFAAAFAVALIIVSFFTPLFSTLVQRSALGGIDQGLGFLFGIARGILLVAIAFFVYDTVVGGEPVSIVDQSRSQVVFSQMTDEIEAQDPEQALGWITSQYNTLVGSCSAQ